MMETTQRGKKRVNKRNNVDKFNENIGPIKTMKDKMKSEKPTLLQGVDGVKSESNLDVDLKKEPVLNNPICENEPKNSVCSKAGDVKCMKPGLMEPVGKIQDRPFIDPKTEIGSRPEDASEEDDLQSNLMSSKIKAENMPPDSNMFPPDSNENLLLGMCNQNPGPPNQGPGMEQPGPGMQPGVQPLPSNVINKQPGTMEAQYMQQQSQIFVFTTALANKSAESVLQGQYPSIIAYHCAQPGTKKYLEKHPLKLNQFHRQSSAQWLNNLAQIKQKTVFGGNAHMKPMGQMPMGPRGPLPGNMSGPCDMPQGPGSGPGPGPGPGPRPVGPNMQGPVPELEGMNEPTDMPPANREMGDHRHGDFPGGVNPMNPINMWNQGNMNQNNMNYSGPMKNIDRDKPCVMTRPPMENMNPNHFPGVSQLTLTGTKVPTENLTPQQRQHRAEQLATLRKMQEILFPENQAPLTDEFGNSRMVAGGNVNPNPDDSNRNNALDNNDMKNQIGLKNVNNSSMSSNNNANNNNNGNNTSGSNNSGSNGNNNGNASGNNNSGNNNSNNNCSNNSPMGRLMGRNINGQSNRNVPLDNPMNHNVVNPPNAVLDTPENIDSMQDQNAHMMQKMHGGNAFPSVAAQLEWQKHYQQFQEEQKKKKGSRTDSPVSRGCNKMQGPPPPYHQTARSASVPIAVPSPNPGSPSNTTSNLSLPSPRTSSDLNSPSDLNKHASASGGSVKMSTCSPPNNQGSPSCSKLMSNNPDTPVSTSASQSPTPTPRKESSQPSGIEFPSKDLFSRSVPSLTQQKHQKQQNASTNKEPNLMPVPSPQQIHYLNTFEGQELTIQKQPNTSLKETTINSPLNHTPLSETPKCKTPNGATNSPLPQVPDTSPRFPSIATSTSTTCTTPVSTQSQTSIPTTKDTTTVPSSPDTAGPSPCRSENLPLNPNGMNCPPNNKSMHFDPITSLAQMSQQLTNQTTPPCPGAGPMMSYNSSSMHMVGNMNHMEQHVVPVGPGGPMGSMGHDNPPMENMQFPSNNPIISCSGPMMDMSPGFINTSSPKQNMGNPPPRCVPPFGFGGGPGGPGPGFQKMMGPNTYNGMNVQVKASTPNTIQYLPARPNANSPNANARGPPSLDFLQRFTNPMNNIDSKVSFIPNCHSNSMDGVNSGQGNPGGPMNCGGPVGNSSGNLMSNSVPNMMLGGNMVLNPGPVGPLRGQLRPGPGGMMKVPQMGGGGPGGPVFPPGPGCDPMVMGPGPGPGNPGMFIQGSKSSPLGMPPDASQPLPPSMSQGNNFKNSPFVGPTVADPNYAQQFHNFQQQLYATNTRSHQMNSHMNQSYFMPK